MPGKPIRSTLWLRARRGVRVEGLADAVDDFPQPSMDGVPVRALMPELGKLAEYQKQCGRAAIEAGASAVLGHHAHMLAGVEFYKGCPIFYCLGNFAFDSDHYFFRRESMIAVCDLSREGVSKVRIIPVMINDQHEPVPVPVKGDGQKVGWFLEYFSEGMNTGFTYRDDCIELSPGGD